MEGYSQIRVGMKFSSTLHTHTHTHTHTHIYICIYRARESQLDQDPHCTCCPPLSSVPPAPYQPFSKRISLQRSSSSLPNSLPPYYVPFPPPPPCPVPFPPPPFAGRTDIPIDSTLNHFVQNISIQLDPYEVNS